MASYKNKLMFYHPKPGALLQVKLVNLLPLNIVMTSREQRLITKEHIAMHTNLFPWFNLNIQVTLVIKLFKGNIRLY